MSSFHNSAILFSSSVPPSLKRDIRSIAESDIGSHDTYISVARTTPFVYKTLGLPNYEVRMYRDKLARAILKNPDEVRHGHADSVSKKIAENLFRNLSNPFYVFKSSDNKSYVGIYDIAGKNGDPVMACFHHQKNSSDVEINVITSIYGKKAKGIMNWAKDRLLYVNNIEKATAISLMLQLQVKDSSVAYINNILRKSDLVNNFKAQLNFTKNRKISPMENIKNRIVTTNMCGKENTMAESKQNSDKVTYVNSEGIKVSVQNGEKKVIPYSQINALSFLKSVENGTAPFISLPLKQGITEQGKVIINPPIIRSAETGRPFKGTNQLVAQIKLAEMGVKGNELITWQQAQKRGTFIMKGAPHITLTTYDAETRKSGFYHYFPKKAVHDENKLPELKITKAAEKVVIRSTDTEPEKYLGKYLAAASMGARFETTPATVKKVQENLAADLKKSFEKEKHFTRIFEIGNKASEICRNTIRDIYKPAQEREQKREIFQQRTSQSFDGGYNS
jgi:hypothetical protein